MNTVRIASRDRVVRWPILLPYEIAFVLHEPEASVRNRMKRGERMRQRGMSDADILLTGALPVITTATGRRGVSPLAAAQHPDLQTPLASEMLAAIAEGRVRAARAATPRDLPPRLIERLHLL